MARKKEIDEAERKKELLRKLRKGPDLDKYVDDKKRRYTSYAGGARIYSMSYYTFIKLAKEAVKNARFDPRTIKLENRVERPEKQKTFKTTSDCDNIARNNAVEDDYVKENSEVRNKIHEKEDERNYYREQYLNVKKLYEELSCLIKKYEEERDELIALMDYVYNSEQENVVE